MPIRCLPVCARSRRGGGICDCKNMRALLNVIMKIVIFLDIAVGVLNLKTDRDTYLYKQ